MESNLKALSHRLNLANLQDNRNPKYRQYASGPDFYQKIGNKMDEMLRVSFFLIKFLTSNPRTLAEELTLVSETLGAYDAQEEENNKRAAKDWKYFPEDYTLYALDGLPVVLESEFDANLAMFHSFISFIKPSSHFIQKHELVPPTRGETRKERTTRVMMNLVQLLVFARSIDETYITDILSVILALLHKFPQLFSLHADDGRSDADGDAKMESTGTNSSATPERTKSFFELYPETSAHFFIVLMAHDRYGGSLDDFREEVEMFTGSPLPNHTADFKKALNNNTFELSQIIADSSDLEECRRRLRERAKLSDFRSQVLDVAKQLSTKAISEVKGYATWDLETTYLDMNYEKIVSDLKAVHEAEVGHLRSKIEEEVYQEQEQEKNELKAKISSSEQEINLLRESNQLQEQEIKVLHTENARLKGELAEVKKSDGLAYPEIKPEVLMTKYPSLYQTVMTSAFRMASRKACTRIMNLEEELDALRRVSQTQNGNNGNADQGADSNNGYTREPDNVEEPENYEVTNFDYNNGYYNTRPPPQRHAPPYYNTDRSYRPPPRGTPAYRSRGPYQF